MSRPTALKTFLMVGVCAFACSGAFGASKSHGGGSHGGGSHGGGSHGGGGGHSHGEQLSRVEAAGRVFERRRGTFLVLRPIERRWRAFQWRPKQ